MLAASISGGLCYNDHLDYFSVVMHLSVFFPRPSHRGGKLDALSQF